LPFFFVFFFRPARTANARRKMSCFSIIGGRMSRLALKMLLQHIYHHPHADQNGFQRLYQCQRFVWDATEIYTCLPTHGVKRRVVLFAIWQEKPRGGTPAPDVVLLHALRAATKTLLWALGALRIGPRFFHTLPENER
jgi:hypothetical protein